MLSFETKVLCRKVLHLLLQHVGHPPEPGGPKYGQPGHQLGPEVEGRDRLLLHPAVPYELKASGQEGDHRQLVLLGNWCVEKERGLGREAWAAELLHGGQEGRTSLSVI